MKRQLPHCTTLLCLFLFLSFSLLGQQDPMFTKYMFNSQVFNPGYAGSKDFFSINILAREQWAGANQPSAAGGTTNYGPSTQTLTFQNPVGERISLGMTVINDQIGAVSSTTANVVYAYHFPF